MWLFIATLMMSFLLQTSPLTLKLRMISSIVVLAPHGEVAKTLHVVRLATHKLIVSVDAVVGVELLATTLADKHMATVLPNYVLVRRLQRLESLFTYITGVNPLHMLLKADPSLEGDVADDKADPSVCHQLGQVSVLQYFRGTAGSMPWTTNMCLYRLDLLEKFMPQWLHCSGKHGRVASGT